MRILSYSLIVLSVAALFAAGIMMMTMTIQTAEAKGKEYCPTDQYYPVGASKKFCESITGKGD